MRKYNLMRSAGLDWDRTSSTLIVLVLGSGTRNMGHGSWSLVAGRGSFDSCKMRIVAVLLAVLLAQGQL